MQNALRPAVAFAQHGAPLPRRATRRVLPGFNITLGYTLAYLSLLVLIPLSATFIKSATLTLALLGLLALGLCWKRRKR